MLEYYLLFWLMLSVCRICLLSWISDNVLQEKETKMSSSLTNVLQYLVWFQAENKSWGLAEKDMGEKSLCIRG